MSLNHHFSLTNELDCQFDIQHTLIVTDYSSRRCSANDISNSFRRSCNGERCDRIKQYLGLFCKFCHWEGAIDRTGSSLLRKHSLVQQDAIATCRSSSLGKALIFHSCCSRQVQNFTVFPGQPPIGDSAWFNAIYRRFDSSQFPDSVVPEVCELGACVIQPPCRHI